MAAMAAVSARRMRGPRVTGCHWWSRKSCNSSGVQPPSGPMARAWVVWGKANTGVSPLRCAAVEMTVFCGAAVEMTTFCGAAVEITTFCGAAVEMTAVWGASVEMTAVWGAMVEMTVSWGAAFGMTGVWG